MMTKLKGHALSACTSAILLAAPVFVQAAETPPAEQAQTLDLSLRPETQPEADSLFTDMGIVQRKAMRKSGRFLFSTFGTLDFSDGPVTQYSVSTNPGVAIGEYFELYANIIPVYMSSERSVVSKINSLQLANNQYATYIGAKPKYAYGFELVWAPLYGKDSLGLSKIIRSDTFLKLGIGNIKYEGGSGLRNTLGVGKTFFTGPGSGIRITADAGYIQTIVDGLKSFRWMLLIEGGLVLYL